MNRITRVSLAVAVFAGFHLMAIFWDGTSAWGVDSLRYFSNRTTLVFCTLTMLILVPRVRQKVIQLVDRAPSPWDSRGGFATLSILLVFAGGAAFLIWPSAVHLLGDGYLLIRDLPALATQVSWKGINSPLNHFLAKQLHQQSTMWWSNPEDTYRTLSRFSGLVYLILVPQACLAFGRSAVSRAVILGLLITPGLLQVFFGYVETYAALMPLLLAFLITGFLAAKGTRPIWWTAFVLGVMIPLHFLMVVFVPSFLVMAYEKEGGDLRRSLYVAAQGMVVVAGISLCILFLIDFNFYAYLGSVKDSHLLPLAGQPGFMHHYRLLSPAHFLDIANQFLLVAPCAVFLLTAFRKSEWLRSSPFLCAASLLPLAFILIANPEVGAFRDWDAFAFVGVPLVIWIGEIASREITGSDLAHVGLLVCVAAGLHTALWIGLNADESDAVKRFRDQLARSTLSPNARSYGWETMGIYYREKGERHEAFDAYREALEANPAHPRHWLSAGNLLNELGQKKDALKYFEKAVSIDSTSAEVFSNMANIYSESGEHDRAIRLLEKSIALKPTYAEVYSNLGNAYYRKGDFEQAVTYYLEAMKLKPMNADIHYNLGNAYLALDEHDEAYRSFDRAASIKPGFTQASYKMANVLFNQGKHEAAVKQLQTLIAMNPGNAKAHSDLGSAFYRLGQFDRAKEHYENAISIRSDLPDPHYYLGNANFASGDYASAVGVYQKAIELRPEYAEAHSNLGSAYGKLNEHLKGIESFRKALELRPRFPGAYYGLGASYAALGRRDEAASCFRKVLELDPDYARKDAIRSWLMEQK
jgi:tetratricopeptide (TPR) repeat protein